MSEGINTHGLVASSAPAAINMPAVSGHCPSCGLKSLFLAVGGWVTCANLNCADPCAAANLFERPAR